MAGQTIPLKVSGVDLLVEVSSVAGSEPTSARLDRAGQAVANAYERTQEAILAIASSTAATISEMGKKSVRPAQVQVKFGLKISTQGGVIVAGVCGEANFEVTLTYRSDAGRVNDGEG